MTVMSSWVYCALTGCIYSPMGVLASGVFWPQVCIGLLCLLASCVHRPHSIPLCALESSVYEAPQFSVYWHFCAYWRPVFIGLSCVLASRMYWPHVCIDLTYSLYWSYICIGLTYVSASHMYWPYVCVSLMCFCLLCALASYIGVC
jgi:hypothetical protein